MNEELASKIRVSPNHPHYWFIYSAAATAQQVSAFDIRYVVISPADEFTGSEDSLVIQFDEGGFQFPLAWITEVPGILGARDLIEQAVDSMQEKIYKGSR